MSQPKETTLNKFQVLQARLESSQFVFGLDVRTLLPVEIAAAAIGKSASTFRSDLLRRPRALPRVTRRHGRVWVLCGDLINWLDGRSGESDDDEAKPKAGRPTKAEQVRRQQAAGGVI